MQFLREILLILGNNIVDSCPICLFLLYCNADVCLISSKQLLLLADVYHFFSAKGRESKSKLFIFCVESLYSNTLEETPFAEVKDMAMKSFNQLHGKKISRSPKPKPKPSSKTGRRLRRRALEIF
ncbi:hypothetical protein SDJN02_20498 [Cucurbita argyrosperma subsp. argyrosperma]|nr:hypothetical protein SDJN02_20498 [Cucurbita argyrosperma subsp. argyrosperma]